MEFFIKKTTELTEKEIVEICQLFEEVFVGHTKSIENFKKEFFNTALGFSYHALMIENNEIVGAHSLIPCDYLLNGYPVLMAFSVDTMIKKRYRDFFNLKDLVDLVEIKARKIGIKFIFGFPNDNSYPILKKGLQYKDIGNMYTYIYPYRLGGIKPKLSFLNCFSISLCRIMEIISRVKNNKQFHAYMIDKNRDLYDKYRYQWLESDYRIVKLSDFQFIYTIKTHENIRTAFIIDLNNVTSSNIAKAIAFIRKHDGVNFDLLMYVGYLPCSCLPMIKIPHKIEPKKFNFTGKFLDKNYEDERWFDIQNWNVNLACYDLV